MDAFEAIGVVAQGNRVITARLWLEALRLVEIPAGTFLMGSPMDEPCHESDEGPQRQVTIDRPFQMGTVPITQGAWKSLMKAKAKAPRFQGDPNLPVTDIVPFDVSIFLDRLNRLTEGVRPAGTEFRLPSEAEWEYACRAGSTTAYSFGDDPAAMADHGWTGGGRGSLVHPVGQKRPNAFGLYDLHGNVWELCRDYWHDSLEGAPQDGSAWFAGGSHRFRVIRGGCWSGQPSQARSASRLREGVMDHGEFVGFRVVCASEPAAKAKPT
jgi:formylglycine-generating enzyme required for sulfatase activity